MNKLKEDKDNILAYTIFDKTNVEYCASVKGLDADGVYIYKLLTGENPLALADGMKPDGLTVTATPKWLSAP